MLLAFTSADMSNTSLINAQSKKRIYEVLSSPPESTSRFTTLRHAPEEEKDRWEGKFVGSVEWAEGLVDPEDAEEGTVEGMVTWGRADADPVTLSTLLRPIEGRGRYARVFSGQMRADYVWSFVSRTLRTPVLQLTSLNSPDPIATYHPPSNARKPSMSTSSSRFGRLPRRSQSQHMPKSTPDKSLPDAPHGYLDISAHALEMLDLIVLTFLMMYLSHGAVLERSLSFRSPRSLSRPSSRSQNTRSPMDVIESPESPPASTPSTPAASEGEGSRGSLKSVRSRPAAQKSTSGSWSKLLAFRPPAIGLGGSMEKLRRLSFPTVGRPRVNGQSLTEV